LSLVDYDVTKIDVVLANTKGNMKTLYTNAQKWFNDMVVLAEKVNTVSPTAKKIVDTGGLGNKDTDYLKTKRDKRKAKEDKKK